MTHEEIRKHYFERLNSYRDSADYARTIGADAPPGPLPLLLGKRWEIDADTYREFREVLPPLGRRGGTFYLSAFTFGGVTTKFSREGDRYYCEYALFPERSVETPWGAAQQITEIAPGIASYSTASHGGIHLSPGRIAEMPQVLRDFVPFGGPAGGDRPAMRTINLSKWADDYTRFITGCNRTLARPGICR